jgi:glucokinase
MPNGKKFWIGFDLGGTKMLATVFDEKFEKVGSKRKKTKGLEGADAGIARMLETIDEAIEEAHIDRSDIGAIGVGNPGPTDLDRGVILEAPNLGWKNVNLKDVLEKKFKCPAAIANDVDAGTYGEYKFGAAKKARCAVGIFPGTGIGGACIYEGRILRGKDHSCMEIGHVQIQRGGRLCGCGRRGCLESTASRLAIASEAATAAFRGEAPHLLAIAGTDLSEIRSGVLAEAIAEGDTVIEEIVRNAARQIGIACGNVVNLLAPDIIVLGGGMVEAMEGLFISEVKKGIEKRAMSSFAKDAEVVAAKLGDDAAVMGAAALAAEAAEEKK